MHNQKARKGFWVDSTMSEVTMFHSMKTLLGAVFCAAIAASYAEAQSRLTNIKQSTTLDSSSSSTSGFSQGEVIVKFKNLRQDPRYLLKNGIPFASATDGSSYLDSLLLQCGTKSARAIFLDRPELTSSAERSAAYYAKLDATLTKFPYGGSNNLNRGALSSTFPDLSAIYVLRTPLCMNPETTCAAFRTSPFVEYCHPNYHINPAWVPNDIYYNSTGEHWGLGYDELWNLKRIGSESAWDHSRGTGTLVAVIDSGVDYTHQDLAANMWQNPEELNGIPGVDDDGNSLIDDIYGADYCGVWDPNPAPTGTCYPDANPQDARGHGTHIAGIIAALGGNANGGFNGGVIGVAPEAKIMAIKIYTHSGPTTSDAVAQAVNYAIAKGAQIINYSSACGNCAGDQTLANAFNTAIAAGRLIVASAGNSNADVVNLMPQSLSDGVVVVAASTFADTRSSFSNFGATVDLAAPGGEGPTCIDPTFYNILSLRAGTLDPNASCQSGTWGGLTIVGTNYLRNRGTSMSAPHVAGAAALLLAQDPTLTPDEVETILKESADDIDAVGPDIYTGAGRLNVATALNGGTPIPLTAAITGPEDGERYGYEVYEPEIIHIRGNALGTDFDHYAVYYAHYETPNYWTQIGTTQYQQSEGFLVNWDASDRWRDIYYIKLVVTAVGGETTEDIIEIELLGPNGGGSCFVAGTPITMADGTLKPIEQIKAGDLVLAYDEETKSFKPDQVKRYLASQTKRGYLVINDEMKVTRDHRFYVGGDWVRARKLKVGDVLLGSDGKEKPITSIRKVRGEFSVFNFDVNPYDSYVAHGVVVHNMDMFSAGANGSGEK